MAPPEAFNPDVQPCLHCGRMQSRKWLCAEGDPRRWFCAGEKAKHGCRNKAKAAKATVWEEGRSTDSDSAAAPSTAVVPAGSRFIDDVAAPPAVAALPSLIMTAWQLNDALLMSQALASAHRSGLSLTSALGLSLSISPSSSDDSRQKQFYSLLSPEMHEVFSEDGQPCLACVMRNGKHYWSSNSVLQREFGVKDGVLQSAIEIIDVFTSFVHPSDTIHGMKEYEETVTQLFMERTRRVACITLPPSRLIKPFSSTYTVHTPEIFLQAIGPNDEHACTCKWFLMDPVESLQHFTPQELTTDRVPLLLVEEADESSLNIHRMRPKLLPRLKRKPELEEGGTPSESGKSSDEGGKSSDEGCKSSDEGCKSSEEGGKSSVSGKSSAEGKSSGEGGKTHDDTSFGSESSSVASPQSSPRSSCEETEGAGMSWSVEELLESVGAA